MAKNIAEDIRNIMTQLEELGSGNYDLEIKVENWDMSSDAEFLNLGINYKISGTNKPATWGYHGGQPAEYPEIDELEIYDADTGQLLNDIPDYVLTDIEDNIWSDVDRRRNEVEPPDTDFDRDF